MRKQLLALLAKKNERKAAISKQAETCENVEELRKLNAELDGVNEEIRGLQGIIDNLPDEEGTTAERTAVVNGDIPSVVSAPAKHARKADDEQMEYRKAFQQFITRGVKIPVELRDDESTLTTDAATAIPTVLVNRVVETLESIGMILPLVTRTSFAAGVSIPTSAVKPVATWVSEGASSDRQKKTTSAITFTWHKLRCEISMSAEMGALAISAFEAAFVRQVSEAMVKAIEGRIVSTNNGAASNKGILAETPATGQALSATALDYEKLVEAEAALPQAYEANAVWCMTKKTFMAIVGMTDAEGQPIARVNYGIGGKPERFILGRPVVLCGDYLDSWSASLTSNKIFAFIFNFSDYVLNTIYDMGIQRKQDWDTEDYLTKAVMSLDGKVIDKGSLVTIKKA